MTPAELKEWRLQAGLTQAQLARLLEVDNSTIARYEQGASKASPMLRFLSVEQLNQMWREYRDRVSTD